MLDPLATSNQIATSKHQIQVCHEQCHYKDCPRELWFGQGSVIKCHKSIKQKQLLVSPFWHVGSPGHKQPNSNIKTSNTSLPCTIPLRLSRYIEKSFCTWPGISKENCKGQINTILFGPPSSIFHLYGKARVNDWNLVFCNLFWFFFFISGEAPQLLKGRLASMSFHNKVFKWNVARLRFICKSFMWKLP